MPENDISAIERLLEPVSQETPTASVCAAGPGEHQVNCRCASTGVVHRKGGVFPASLLAERPDWDTLEMPAIGWKFLRWLFDQHIDVVAMSALPDIDGAVSRYLIIQPEPGVPGRYRVSLCTPDALADVWLLAPPRHRMDIRAAHELMGRLVAGTAG